MQTSLFCTFDNEKKENLFSGNSVHIRSDVHRMRAHCHARRRVQASKGTVSIDWLGYRYHPPYSECQHNSGIVWNRVEQQPISKYLDLRIVNRESKICIDIRTLPDEHDQRDDVPHQLCGRASWQLQFLRKSGRFWVFFSVTRVRITGKVPLHFSHYSTRSEQLESVWCEEITNFTCDTRCRVESRRDVCGSNHRQMYLREKLSFFEHFTLNILHYQNKVFRSNITPSLAVLNYIVEDKRSWDVFIIFMHNLQYWEKKLF